MKSDGYYGIYKYITDYAAKLHFRRQKLIKTWMRIMKVSFIYNYYPVIQMKSGHNQDRRT